MSMLEGSKTHQLSEAKKMPWRHARWKIEDVWCCIYTEQIKYFQTDNTDILKALLKPIFWNMNLKLNSQKNIDMLKMVDQLHLYLRWFLSNTDEEIHVEHSYPKNKKHRFFSSKKNTFPTPYHRNVWTLSKKSFHKMWKTWSFVFFPWRRCTCHCVAWPFWCSAAVKNRTWDSELFGLICIDENHLPKWAPRFTVQNGGGAPLGDSEFGFTIIFRWTMLNLGMFIKLIF